MEGKTKVGINVTESYIFITEQKGRVFRCHKEKKEEFKMILCNIKRISSNLSEHCLFLTQDGKVHILGKHSKDINRIQFFIDKKVKSIHAGMEASFFVLENGKVFVSGCNDTVKLGIKVGDRTILEPKELKTTFFKDKKEKIADSSRRSI